MKKIVLFVFIAVVTGGIVFAQSTSSTTVIRGTLNLNNERISVISGGITYYVRGLEQYIGSIDGLRNGAQVSLEGYVSAQGMENQAERFFLPVKLSFNGKDYEISSPVPGNAAFGRYGTDSNRRREGFGN